MPAIYRSGICEFLGQNEDAIIGRLSAVASGAFTELTSEQLEAWRQQIRLLRSALSPLSDKNLHLLLEYPIPRRGKRIDAVIIGGGPILVIEFKCGAQFYDQQARIQVEDYCLDLRDFHRASRDRILVPILVATRAVGRDAPTNDVADSIAPIWCANSDSLGRVLTEAFERYSHQARDLIDPELWDNADYAPTPTIIEAARTLYEGQNVREISRCHAGAANLTKTSAAVISAIQDARRDECKLICLVTGVRLPGSS